MYARDYRQLARENLAGNWGLSILVAFVASLLGGAIGGSSFSIDIDAEILAQLPPVVQSFINGLISITAVLSFVQFVIGGAVQLGNCHYVLKQHDHEAMEFNDLFSEFQRLGAGIVLNLLIGIFTFLWTLLFIVPGIMASYSYSMAHFILAEHPEMSAKDAIKASKELMHGHRWELFCLDISFIGWVLLSTLTLGIGSLFLNPYTAASRAAFYRQLCPRGSVVDAAPVTEQIDPPCEF